MLREVVRTTFILEVTMLMKWLGIDENSGEETHGVGQKNQTVMGRIMGCMKQKHEWKCLTEWVWDWYGVGRRP